MLALHGIWATEGPGTLVVWAEDGDLPAAGPPRRGRPPTVLRPNLHPFAAPVGGVVAAIAGTGSASARSAAAGSEEGRAVLWLPGRPRAPEPSSQLVRSVDDPPGSPPPRAGSSGDGAFGLWPYVVPVLRCPAGPALDLLLALTTVSSPDVHVGASINCLSTVAGLALEMVAGGRVLPDLVVEGGGRRLARWGALVDGSDTDRMSALAASLPPVCRALDDRRLGDPFAPAGLPPSGADPATVVGHALGAFVDSVCRDALARSRRSLVPATRRPTSRRPSATESWLAALVGQSPVVEADPGELAKLERLVGEWRAGAAGRSGPWRLCFRLCEPDEPDEPDEPGEADGPTPAGNGTPGDAGESGRWRIDLLLQATDDLSLVVEAGEVWRSGEVVRRAARALHAPHEVLLGELGRAVRAYPELATALRQQAPTGLDLDLDAAHAFLVQTAPALEVAGFGVLLPAWWRRPSSRLGVRLRSASASPGGAGAGGLDQAGLCRFDWQAALGDQHLSVAELRRLARLKAPLVKVRGQWAELRPGEAEKLAAFLAAGRHRAERTMTVADVLRLAAGAEPSVAGVPVVGVDADGTLGALLRGELEGVLEVRGTPAGFSGELRPYQQRGVAWLDLLERTGLGACLADDMGLGKTATVLAVLQAERRPPPRKGARPARRPPGPSGAGTAGTRPAGTEPAPAPTLVVCPTSVVGNWQREAQRFTPELRVYVHHGAGRARAGALAAAVAAVDLVVTSYSLVERDAGALREIGWHRVVLDEAQNVKNPEAKQTKAVRTLRAGRRVALTGTPVENHLGELWSIMDILNPGLLGSSSAFRERFALPIERFREEGPAEQLRALTRPFVLRRLKTDRTIISDLPEKFEMKVLCTLTREQATLYQAVVDEMLRRIEESEGIERKGLVLATMLRLKQVCNHPAHYLGDGSAIAGRSGKLERTVEILEEVRDRDEKALVFTQFAEMGTILRDHLQHRLGCRVGYLHGGVPRLRRDEMVQAFQSGDEDLPLMVLSLKAGGTGLNLTAANHVIHFDRWWNPAVENQATDRAFRIGQRRDVQVRKLVCTGTLEDRIDQMIEAKRELAELVVGAGEGWLTELSTDELADVLRLSAETVGAG